MWTAVDTGLYRSIQHFTDYVHVFGASVRRGALPTNVFPHSKKTLDDDNIQTIANEKHFGDFDSKKSHTCTIYSYTPHESLRRGVRWTVPNDFYTKTKRWRNLFNRCCLHMTSPRRTCYLNCLWPAEFASVINVNRLSRHRVPVFNKLFFDSSRTNNTHPRPALQPINNSRLFFFFYIKPRTAVDTAF